MVNEVWVGGGKNIFIICMWENVVDVDDDDVYDGGGGDDAIGVIMNNRIRRRRRRWSRM